MKKILLVLAAGAIMFSGCAKKAESAKAQDSSKPLVVWSFTDEL